MKLVYLTDCEITSQQSLVISVISIAISLKES